MNKIGVVIKREYFTRVRSKAFLIATVLSPLLLLGLILIPAVLAAKSGGDRHIFVLDQSGDEGLFAGIRDRLDTSAEIFDSKGQIGNMRFRLERVVVPPDQNIDELAQIYNDRIEQNSNEA